MIIKDYNDRQRMEDTPSIPAVMEKGNGMTFSGRIVRGGGANISNRPRRALTLAFWPGWLVPEEAYPFDPA